MKMIVRGDTDAVQFTVEKRQTDGTWIPPTDLAGATVRVTIQPVDRALGWVFEEDGTLEDADEGIVSVEPAADSFPGEGDTPIDADVTFTLASGKTRTYKVRSPILVVDHLG